MRPELMEEAETMEDSRAMVVHGQDAPPPMTPIQMREQVNHIQAVMREVMKEGEHYGVIPGCGNKPALLKAGAEKLGHTFHLDPKFFIAERQLSGQHREYRVHCYLRHHWSGRVWQGVGLCSTMESKYRYRNGVEPTDSPIPQAYWENRDAKLLGGKGFRPCKNDDGKWVIGKVVKEENPDIADTFNTVLKMAKKRAHVDAVLTATAASDIFTQDIEDLPVEHVGSPEREAHAERPSAARPVPADPQPVEMDDPDAWRTAPAAQPAPTPSGKGWEAIEDDKEKDTEWRKVTLLDAMMERLSMRGKSDKESLASLTKDITKSKPGAKGKPFGGFTDVDKLKHGWQVEKAWEALRSHEVYGDEAMTALGEAV